MVEIKMGTLYRVIGVFLLAISWIHAEETWRVTSYNCGQKSVDIDKAGVVYLRYSGERVSDCVFEFLSDDFGPDTCFKITQFSNVQCGQSVKYEYYGTTAKTFSCYSSSWGEEYCDIYSEMKVIFDSTESTGYGGDITVKVYTKEDNVIESTFTSVIAIIGIVIGVIVGGVCLVGVLICCCCNKRRSSAGQVVGNQQQTTTTAAYPATSPAAYHPGYQTGYAPPPTGGYPAQPAGYPQAPAGYPQQPAGYPPQSSGYTPQQQQLGYPPQPAPYPGPTGRYSPQPPTYPSQDQAQGSSQPGDLPEKQKLMATAPPPEDIQMGEMPPPPPYPGI